tara:strand:- start:105 stop:338 length:234 start_codon:yes stop_codon:yes gene_type:complete
MTKQLIITKENPNGVEANYTSEEIAEFDLLQQTETTEEAKIQTAKNNQASGNQKLLDLGLTQAEATALTGYTPPVEE